MTKFNINNRYTDELIYAAEIDCPDGAPYGTKLGLAVKAVVAAEADLSRANLSDANLARAYLSDANLARAYLSDADLSGAYLSGADLSGADLSRANLARANLARANLSRAYLARAYLARANLARADLSGANLARADLSGAYLSDADLSGADLSRANLSRANLARANLARANLAGANLADAINAPDADESGEPPIPTIPSIENIDAAILKEIENGGELDMGSWHTCETTHCRAGWAIHLAGEAGRALEERHGSFIAGCLIYDKSRPDKPPPHFFATDDAAMEDIRKCAAEQIGGGRQPETQRARQ